MDGIFNILNNSKLFGGMTMLLMNLGGRHILRDVPEFFDDLFETPLVRRFIVFCIAFIATRDVKSSILITLLFVIIFSYLLKEGSATCIIPKKYLKNKKKVSKDEYIKALDTIKRYKVNKN